MAKEIYLIGVGPDGRDSLTGSTLKLLGDCHLIIGGKRVISQFEDMDVPTYTMTANLRQLVGIIDRVEEAVTAGRDVRALVEGEVPSEDEDDDSGDGGFDTDDEGQEGRGEGGRRRGRRRTSPRSRGRSRGEEPQDGPEEGGTAEAAERGEGAETVSESPGGRSRRRRGRRGGSRSEAKAAGGEGEAPEKSVLDADDGPVGMTVELSGAAPEPEEEPGEERVEAASDAEAEAGVAVAIPEEDAAEGSGEPEGDTAGSVATEEEVAESAGAEGTQDEPAEESDRKTVTRIAVLASGDPNFYGLSKFLLERFKKEEVRIIPNVSAVQLAFSAIKEPMNDAAITSSSGRNVDRLLRVVRQNAKVGIFTDKRRSPRAVARLLLKHHIEAQCYVCQDLGTPRERIIMGSLEDIAEKNFSPLSIMILFKSVTEEPQEAGREAAKGAEAEAGKQRRAARGNNLREMPAQLAPKYELVTSLGIPDDLLAARPEKIMRAEMRVIVLSKLRVEKGSRVWDVGAGAGALSVEAARVANEGEVFAVERDFSQIRNIYENIKGMGVGNVTVMEGDIEELAPGLPEPDRIFIGGCGGRMKNVLEVCLKRLKPEGTMVINATTLDALTDVQQTLATHRLKHEMVIVNISRTVERGGLEYFEGFNPGYLITTVKD